MTYATKGNASTRVCAAEFVTCAAKAVRVIDTTDEVNLIVGVGAKGDAGGSTTPDGAAVADVAALGCWCHTRNRACGQ